MPFDANGNYTLPVGYLAVPDTTILDTQHNLPLEDIRTALSSTLVRDGRAPMSGPLSITDGTVSALPFRFANDNDTGIYRIGTNEAALVAGGTIIARWKLDGATPKLLDSTGAKTYPALTGPVSTFAETILDDADAAAVLSTIGAPPATRMIGTTAPLAGGDDLAAKRSPHTRG